MSQLLAPSAYVGPVGTRVSLPSNYSGSAKMGMTETYHMIMDDITAVIAVYANFLGYTQATEAASGGGAQTMTFSAENPLLAPGVRNQGRFYADVNRLTGEGITTGPGTGTGGTSVSVADGSFTFAVAPLVAKRGTEIILRNWASAVTGLIYSQNGNNAKDKMTYGNSGIADQTLSGTVVNGAGSNAVRPVAILGVTRRRTIFIAGDSIGQYNYNVRLFAIEK